MTQSLELILAPDQNRTGLGLSDDHSAARLDFGLERGQRNEFAVEDLSIERGGFRFRREVQLGGKGIHTSLILSQRVMAATCQSMSTHQLAMDGFIRFILRQQRREQWKDPFVLVGIAIKRREREAGIMILTAQGFA